MFTVDRLRDVRNLDYILDSLPNTSALPKLIEEVVTGYAEMDLETGEITCYDGRPPIDS